VAYCVGVPFSFIVVVVIVAHSDDAFVSTSTFGRFRKWRSAPAGRRILQHDCGNLM
jgi:hypothetical protein